MKIDVCIAAVGKYKNLIKTVERDLWKMPATGYKEDKASSYLAEKYESLGYKLTYAGNIPGFTAEFDTGKEGPTLLFFSELDSLICEEHPDADPVTGAVHACGHNAQGAALLGFAAALKENGVADGMFGKIRFCAVPAEELIELDWRETQKKAGRIHYSSGKPEFLYRGLLDGCDIACMVHTSSGSHVMCSVRGSNGCIAKTSVFEGKASHAGSAPDRGINALYAAETALSAANALRETFRDDDHIRFHPIVTEGGTAVNAIPARVTVESYVRGAELNSIVKVNNRINRAFACSAAAFGGNLTIRDRHGFMPLINEPQLNKKAIEVMQELFPDSCYHDEWDTASTDMGDISSVIPSVHLYTGGATGTGHGSDYRISDPDSACIDPAEFQLLFASRLLENGASEAYRIIKGASTVFANKAEYFSAVDSVNADIRCAEYGENGTVKITYAKDGLAE